MKAVFFAALLVAVSGGISSTACAAAFSSSVSGILKPAPPKPPKPKPPVPKPPTPDPPAPPSIDGTAQNS